ncbi:MAG TPA: Crp/Fnr family transcriptional regulator [Deltaproteobacteria bacterium]|nr:Crp/Fnr family transcriptional regulator [Deltaproteobacteria bacterium]
MSSLEFLRQVPLFQSLSKANTEKLAAVLRRQSLKKGEALFRKGAEGTTLYIIAEGAIKIVLPSRMGSEVILAIFSEGDFFGEMALLDGRPRSADAVALSPCEVLALNRRDFLAFLKNNEEAIRSILYSLSMRLRKTDDLLEDTCFLNISGRFAKKLVELADTYGRREGDTILIDLRLSQKDMASMVGATRESINKEFRVLREKGLVSVTESTIRIHNLERLKRRIH